MKRFSLFISFIGALVTAQSWAQTSTPTNTPSLTPTATVTSTPTMAPVTILFPASNPSSTTYQMYRFDPGSNQWSLISFSTQGSGNAVGLLSPVTTFNGQYAIVQPSSPPNGDSFTTPSSSFGCGQYPFTVGGSTQTLTITIFNESGEVARQNSMTLSPGNYLWNVSDKSFSGLTGGCYFLQVNMGGTLLINGATLCWSGGGC